MIWIILAVAYAVGTIASFVAFWYEDVSWGRRPTVRDVGGFALVWWLVWGFRIGHGLRVWWLDRRYIRQSRRESKVDGRPA